MWRTGSLQGILFVLWHSRRLYWEDAHRRRSHSCHDNVCEQHLRHLIMYAGGCVGRAAGDSGGPAGRCANTGALKSCAPASLDTNMALVHDVLGLAVHADEVGPAAEVPAAADLSFAATRF